MNVLITSAGRRTSLLAAFKEAAHRRSGKLLACDMDGLAPALYQADKAIRVPRVTSEEYIPCLLDLVRTEGVRLVVPTTDTELAILAANAAAFHALGCKALVASARLVGIAGDKWQTQCEFGARGVRVPASWLPQDLPESELPEHLFVKPRDGSASMNTHRVRRAHLSALLPSVPNAIIQEYISAPEMTVDALLDFSGRPLHYVPRLRLRAVGGESIQGTTLPDAEIGSWIRGVLETVSALGGQGPITLQAFLPKSGPVFSEINPRFGGGYPLTLAAGGDYPEWLLQLLEGREAPPRLGEYRHPLYMTRSYTEIFTEAPLWR